MVLVRRVHDEGWVYWLPFGPIPSLRCILGYSIWSQRQWCFLLLIGGVLGWALLLHSERLSEVIVAPDSIATSKIYILCLQQVALWLTDSWVIETAWLLTVNLSLSSDLGHVILLLSEVEYAFSNILCSRCDEPSHFRSVSTKSFIVGSWAVWIDDKRHVTMSLKVVWADQLSSISLLLASSAALWHRCRLYARIQSCSLCLNTTALVWVLLLENILASVLRGCLCCTRYCCYRAH